MLQGQLEIFTERIEIKVLISKVKGFPDMMACSNCGYYK